MEHKKYKFSSQTVDCFFDAHFSYLHQIVPEENIIIIIDENVAALHAEKFAPHKKIVIPAGEEHKQQATVDDVIKKLIGLKADRSNFIVGVGGGVVTDVAGYAASVYMRGIKFGFIPTSILAMVDAAIGGKNGVDVGVYKNLVGTTKHPEFLLYDYSFLKTLPDEEWVNGFAEIIKHACIKDEALFELLENNSLENFQRSHESLARLIKGNVEIKCHVVEADEFEKNERRILNFGHTVGHAVENMYRLPHGSAIAIGMVAAANISSSINSFSSHEQERITDLLKKYKLPVELNFDKEKVWEVLVMDKKRSGNIMNFILLNKIGEAVVKSIELNVLKELFNQL